MASRGWMRARKLGGRLTAEAFQGKATIGPAWRTRARLQRQRFEHFDIVPTARQPTQQLSGRRQAGVRTHLEWTLPSSSSVRWPDLSCRDIAIEATSQRSNETLDVAIGACHGPPRTRLPNRTIPPSFAPPLTAAQSFCRAYHAMMVSLHVDAERALINDNPIPPALLGDI